MSEEIQEPPPAITEETLAEIERLDREATAGPWKAMRDGNQFINTSYIPTAKGVAASRIEGVVRPWNPHAYLAFGFRPKDFETVRFVDADADLVAALRNHAGPLIALARQALERSAIHEAELRVISAASIVAREGGHPHDIADLRKRLIELSAVESESARDGGEKP